MVTPAGIGKIGRQRTSSVNIGRRRQCQAAHRGRKWYGTQQPLAPVDHLEIATWIAVTEKGMQPGLLQAAKEVVCGEDRPYPFIGAGAIMFAQALGCIDAGQDCRLARCTLRPSRQTQVGMRFGTNSASAVESRPVVATALWPLRSRCKAG